MALEQTIHISSNGDTWSLVGHERPGGPFVRHRPNRSSGGASSETTVAEFFSRGNGPEHEALRQLQASMPPNAEPDRPGARPPASSGRPVSAAQIRAGRGLLGWSAERLAREAQIPLAVLRACEESAPQSTSSHLADIRAALAAGGVIFLADGDQTEGGPGVRAGP